MSFLFITFFWFTFLPFDQDLSLEALLIWVRCFLFQQPYVLWYQEGVSLGVVSHVGGKVHRLKACGGHIRITRRVEWDFVGISYFFKDFIFSERGGEGEREGEKHQRVVASGAPSNGDLAYNPGMCPDWELNWQAFGSQAGTQSTDPHQPGLLGISQLMSVS